MALNWKMALGHFQQVSTRGKLVTNLLNMVALSDGWSLLGRMTLMPIIYLVVAALAVGFEQLVQMRYGVMGILAFLALSLGIKARNTLVGGIGAVVLVMLLAQSG
jgi:hypothetical protein